jgi:integrase/recombinase XerD
MRAISHRKLPRRLPRVLDVKEVEAIIAAARTPFERVIPEVLYATGVRVGEFVKIRVENVDSAEHIIKVVNGKGGKDRYVLYGSHAARAIAEYQAWKGPSASGYLFESPARGVGHFQVDGKSWIAQFYTRDGRLHRVSLGRNSALAFPTEQAARAAFAKMAAKFPEALEPAARRPAGPYGTRRIHVLVQELGRRAGVKGVHPHSFRRAMACHMLANGGDLRAIQTLLGHATLSTTMIYTTLTNEKLQEIHERCHPHAKSADTPKED